MNAIELTSEHKSKLLEMCKVLFPEYSNYTFWGNGDFVGMYNIDENGEEIVEGNTSIHWFEFCINYLATKIYNLGDYYSNYILISQFRGYLCQDVEHPVDYLYDEFKSIN